MQAFIEKYQSVFIRIIVAIGILLAIFLFAATIAKMKQIRYIGSGVAATNTITVSGQGKIERAPDTARVTFSARNESRNVKDAQSAVSSKIDAITKALKDAGINEKDIKTDSYNSYPQYTYPEVTCMALDCPKPGSPVIRGYEVTHTVTVAVKDLEKIETVLGIVGAQGASDIIGPNFGFEDDKAVVREARELAIEDAKKEARKLADALGVDLVRIVSFQEQGSGMPMYERAANVSMQAKVGDGVSLPIGDQKIQSAVTLVYEIR